MVNQMERSCMKFFPNKYKIKFSSLSMASSVRKRRNKFDTRKNMAGILQK